MTYRDTSLHVAGQWRAGAGAETLDVLNPATGEPIGTVAVAAEADLQAAAEAAARGFDAWRAVSAYERSKVMRQAAGILRGKADDIARTMTLEQGKPLVEARTEAANAADLIEWFAEEGRRAYGRLIPARSDAVQQAVVKEPVGPVVAFTPWNFPLSQSVRKLAAALCTGCSVILKGPEETPASCAALIGVFLEAGVPGDVLNLVFGRPAEISRFLIAHPLVRKVSFTGSTAVGRQIASLAGLHMKRITLELGGHAPVILFADADMTQAARVLPAQKFRNAGQVCVSPTRFLVHESLFEPFVAAMAGHARALKVGDGLAPATSMGPLAHARRLDAMEALVADAVGKGASLITGGKRLGNRGFFFEPTVLADLPMTARIMNEEPFGPVAVIQRFSQPEEAIAEANRLPFGLAAYAYTRSSANAALVARKIQSGMISINHHGLGLPETPFGGVKDSGYGSEGGSEALDGYLATKLVSHAA
ncbi:NAD-dependent succinate-semialdehyde dehydrogenase [Vineibacter terrae]|uniref:NAD-dependent succinate-semialdehyde dehydrogenase n=1 Tax=Vineibacter terrae TaxID=2586908 RepID=A0A5C8PB90_9HYPH|nr:NAD-dependent succinate-semialdehyde dehydrogenase [Vineibacter terrae]TXL70633.1 NAD-dependent succinate-semialdehyde dehydrogenase [Vineibacter terrae]